MITRVRDALGCADGEEFEKLGDSLATTDVWRSEVSVVKRMRAHDKLRNELAFYRDAAPLVPARTAALLGHCVDPIPCIRVSRLDGRLVAATPQLQTALVYRVAAEAIRALHNVPFEDRDPLSLDDAIEARFESWIPRFSAVAPVDLRGHVIGRWSRRPPLEMGERRRTHRDYSDRNWIWDETAEVPLGMFDFEQSRPDHPWMDATRLWECDFHGRGDLKAAFLEGYGGPADMLTHPDFQSLALLHALATVAWATEVVDTEHASAATRALWGLLGER